MVSRKPNCKIKNCTTLSIIKGFCSIHYTRFLRHGDPFYCDDQKIKFGKYLPCAYCKKVSYKTKAKIEASATGKFFCSRRCSYKFLEGKFKPLRPMKETSWKVKSSSEGLQRVDRYLISVL